MGFSLVKEVSQRFSFASDFHFSSFRGSQAFAKRFFPFKSPAKFNKNEGDTAGTFSLSTSPLPISFLQSYLLSRQQHQHPLGSSFSLSNLHSHLGKELPHLRVWSSTCKNPTFEPELDQIRFFFSNRFLVFLQYRPVC